MAPARLVVWTHCYQYVFINIDAHTWWIGTMGIIMLFHVGYDGRGHLATFSMLTSKGHSIQGIVNHSGYDKSIGESIGPLNIAEEHHFAHILYRKTGKEILRESETFSLIPSSKIPVRSQKNEFFFYYRSC